MRGSFGLHAKLCLVYLPRGRSNLPEYGTVLICLFSVLYMASKQLNGVGIIFL